jgi:hypothetical protein
MLRAAPRALAPRVGSLCAAHGSALPAALRRAGGRRPCVALSVRVRGVRVSAAKDGADVSSPVAGDAASDAEPGARASTSAAEPAVAGVRAKLRAVRALPVVRTVLAGAAAAATRVSQLPLVQRRSRLHRLAKAADDAADDAGKEDAYLTALAERRCARPCVEAPPARPCFAVSACGCLLRRAPLGLSDVTTAARPRRRVVQPRRGGASL